MSANGKRYCIVCHHAESEELDNADDSAARTKFWSDLQHAAPIDWGDKGSLTDLDTGHYDDGTRSAGRRRRATRTG